MTELKTLKDITGIYSNGDNKLGPLHINEEELRQEAIKWIQHLKEEYKIDFKLHPDGSLELDRKPNGYIFGKAIGMVESFIIFFNITGKDLVPSAKTKDTK